MKAATVTDEEHIIMGCATYRLLDSLIYVQFFQYEPPKKDDRGYTNREGVIKISTDDRKDVPSEEKENDLSQSDAIYLAINFPYLPTDKQKKINFDTSNG